MSQTIPNTDSVTVAEITVAWAMVEASAETNPNNGRKKLGELIELYKKAIDAVHNAHFGSATSSPE